MSYGFRTFLKIIVELFIVTMIIIYAIGSLNKVRMNYGEFYNDEIIKQQLVENMSFDKYNDSVVNGAEVYYAIKYYKGSDVGICIKFPSRDIFFNKKVLNGQYVLGALQEEDDYTIDYISSLIDFEKTYKSKLVEHKNGFVACVEFTEIGG